MSGTYGQVGGPDPAPGGSLGRPWQPPQEIVPCEVRPSRLSLVLALVLLVIVVAALLTQQDSSDGFLPAVFTVAGFGLVLVAIRSLVARIRLDGEGITHVDLIGRRRIALVAMDRPVVVEPRRRTSAGESYTRGYELIIRKLGGRGPWLLATGLFWDRRGLERMGNALGAPTSSARTRAAVEKTYPGATTWLLRRTSTQWSIAMGAALMIGLVLWQTR